MTTDIDTLYVVRAVSESRSKDLLTFLTAAEADAEVLKLNTVQIRLAEARADLQAAIEQFLAQNPEPPVEFHGVDLAIDALYYSWDRAYTTFYNYHELRLGLNIQAEWSPETRFYVIEYPIGERQ